MADPKRVRGQRWNAVGLAGALAAAQRRYPDQRLGQIILNAVALSDPTLYNVEDEDLILTLNRYAERIHG